MCRSSKTKAKTKTKTKYLKIAAVITGKVVISWSGVHVQKFIKKILFNTFMRILHFFGTTC